MVVRLDYPSTSQILKKIWSEGKAVLKKEPHPEKKMIFL
jgi:hypothetical protein